MQMSHRRAWLLIDCMHKCFREPVISAKLGGRHGGSTNLTPFGSVLICHYRAMEAEARAALAKRLSALQDATVEVTNNVSNRRAPCLHDG
jgi:molybdate transport system regulatory protein